MYTLSSATYLVTSNLSWEIIRRKSVLVGSAAAVKCITVWYLATHKQILKCKMSAIFLSVISQLSQVSHSFGSQLNHFPKGENFANIAQLLPLIPPVYLFMILVAFSGIIVSSNWLNRVYLSIYLQVTSFFRKLHLFCCSMSLSI